MGRKNSRQDDIDAVGYLGEKKFKNGINVQKMSGRICSKG
jgi:hypothetical protein